MANLNRIMIIGNAGKDAEMRYTASGQAQASFSVAVNHNRRNQAGEWESETEWFNVTLFGDSAERLAPLITKGKSVYCEGRLQTRSWTSDDGQKHYRTEVIAHGVQLLGARGQEEQ